MHPQVGTAKHKMAAALMAAVGLAAGSVQAEEDEAAPVLMSFGNSFGLAYDRSHTVSSVGTDVRAQIPLHPALAVHVGVLGAMQDWRGRGFGEGSEGTRAPVAIELAASGWTKYFAADLGWIEPFGLRASGANTCYSGCGGGPFVRARAQVDTVWFETGWSERHSLLPNATAVRFAMGMDLPFGRDILDWNLGYAVLTPASPVWDVYKTPVLGAGLTRGRFRVGLQAWVGGSSMTGLGLQVSLDGAQRLARLRERLARDDVVLSLPPVPSPPRRAETSPEAAAFDDLFRPGRSMTWAVTGEARSVHRCRVVQRRDFALNGEVGALVRLDCADGVAEDDPQPVDGPRLLRTGCHALDRSGLWRLPRCPDQPEPQVARATLVLPGPALSTTAAGRYFSMGHVGDAARSVEVGGQQVQVRCRQQFLPGIEQLCTAEDLGLAWATASDGRTIQLLALGQGEPEVDELMRFSKLTGPDLACRLLSGCPAFGLCHFDRASAAVRPRCVPLGDGDCRSALVCQRDGQCTAQAGSCIAQNDADCQSSPLCADHGQCSAVRGRCRAHSAAGCLEGPSCRAHARCSWSDGRCVVGGDGDCRKGSACSTDGLCTAKGGGCIAFDDGSCAASIACTSQGRCRAQLGACVP
ncbi:MAG: hypothetical protein HY902_12850 [Deltaproteobacteria bacterium]|nr:hypothetical protein [Deltaproteobacteria bacterium]